MVGEKQKKVMSTMRDTRERWIKSKTKKHNSHISWVDMAIKHLTPILEQNNKLQHLTNFLQKFREINDEKLEVNVALFRANHDNEDLQKEINKIRHQLNWDKKSFESNSKRKDFYTRRIKEISS